MIASLLGFTLLAQPAPPPVELPWASSPAFRQAVVRVTKLASQQKFTEAQQVLNRMPTRALTVGADWKGVDGTRRVEWSAAIDAALAEWQRAMPALKLTRSEKSPDIRISFAPTLPPNVNTVGPAGAVFFQSLEPKEPRVEGVVALARGSQKTPISAREVQNEAAFAVATALGLDQTTKTGTVTDRRETAYPVENRVTFAQARLATELIEIVDRLRASMASKKAPNIGIPSAFVDLRSKDVGTVDQGEVPTFSFQITNRGSGPLLYNIVPDCGCFRLAFTGRVEPGKTELVRVSMETMDYPGAHDRALFIYTNDPEFEMRRIPVSINAVPLVRWLGDTRPVYVADDNGLTFKVIAVFNQRVSLVPVTATLIGAMGVADIKPWSGTINGKALKGYEVSVLIGPDLAPGRVNVNLRLAGADPRETYTPTWTFLVQKGIGAFPGGAYFGEINRTPNTCYFTLSRPGKPFRITRIELKHPHLKASFATTKLGEEYRVAVEFDGRGPFGVLDAVLTIHTDDPKQPTLTLPVSGVVK